MTVIRLAAAVFLVWWVARDPVAAGHELVRSGDFLATRFGHFVAAAETSLRAALSQHPTSTNEILKGAK